MQVNRMIFVLMLIVVMVGVNGIAMAQQQQMPTTIPEMIKLMEGYGSKVVHEKAKIVEVTSNGTAYRVTYDIVGKDITDSLEYIEKNCLRGAHLVKTSNGQIDGFLVTSSIAMSSEGGGLCIFRAHVTHSYPQGAEGMFQKGDEVDLLLPTMKK